MAILLCLRRLVSCIDHAFSRGTSVRVSTEMKIGGGWKMGWHRIPN
jgi:hypothetical protein